MTTKTIAERIVDAYHAGAEAIFYYEDVPYFFTPAGIADYIGDSQGYVTDDEITDFITVEQVMDGVLTEVEIISAGGAITIPAESTLVEALQILADAIDPAP